MSYFLFSIFYVTFVIRDCNRYIVYRLDVDLLICLDLLNVESMFANQTTGIWKTGLCIPCRQQKAGTRLTTGTLLCMWALERRGDSLLNFLWLVINLAPSAHRPAVLTAQDNIYSHTHSLSTSLQVRARYCLTFFQILVLSFCRQHLEFDLAFITWYSFFWYLTVFHTRLLDISGLIPSSTLGSVLLLTVCLFIFIFFPSHPHHVSHHLSQTPPPPSLPPCQI